MGFWQSKIYPLLPVFAQNLAISAYGYKWHQRRFGGIYSQELAGFRKREQFTFQQWRDYQTLQLRKLLLHTFETVPYYLERFQSLGFTKTDFERFEVEDLKKLPYLEKEDLRAFGTTSMISSKREKGGAFFSSSGSTGTPVKILYSFGFHQRMNAAMEARVRNWAGVSGKDARGMIGGRRILPDAENQPPFYRYNYVEKQTYLSAYHISKKNAGDYLEGITKKKVAYMTGYATSNYLLACLFQELGFEVPQLKAVITSSEKLTPSMRSIFYKVYGCKTFDSYSGVENCGLISENQNGEFCVHPDVGIMEILNKQGDEVGRGDEGDAVCTGLLNFDQPLIRYRIGDQLRRSVEIQPKSGLEMELIDEIVGRVEDVIFTKDGRQMVRFHGIFIDLPHILQGQVIQHTLNTFTVNVLTKPGFNTKEENQIISRMKSQLGRDAFIQVVEVAEIPRTKNGKFKGVISELL